MAIQYEVHPAADCFRMMRDDELEALATDILANGQRDPATLGRINGHVATWLVDGRNRVKACGRVKVEPTFETIDFKDENELRMFVRSRNERRDLSLGERAMGLAMLFPAEPEKGGRGKKTEARKAAEAAGFSDRRIREAQQVFRYSPTLAASVRDGTIKLDAAMEQVKAGQQMVESEEHMVTRLRAEAPDLADLVIEARMKPKEAIAALDARNEEHQRKQRTAMQLVATLMDVWHPRGSDPADYCARLTMNAKAKFWPPNGSPLTRENLRAVAAVVAALEGQLEKWEGE